MEEIFKSSLAVIGGVIVAGGGLAAMVYGLFRYLGDKWLSAKFDERLAAYKHAQQRELEGLKFEINKLMDRTVKLHQREFEVLPEAWGRLVEAHSVVAAFVSAVQSYADVDRMTPAHLDEFLEKSPLMSWQKAELKDSARKTDTSRRSSGTSSQRRALPSGSHTYISRRTASLFTNRLRQNSSSWTGSYSTH